MYRFVHKFAAAGLVLAATSITIAPANAFYGACRAPFEATGHGQAMEPTLVDYGQAYARRMARQKWIAAVAATDGARYSYLRNAHDVSYSEDRGAGQIYITLKATPCR